VKILVPHRVDHWLPYWAAYAYFDELRQAGGEIWRYLPGFMHQKVALVDDDITSVGSVNLDIRSGLLNFELTVLTESREAARRMEAMLMADFAEAVLLERDLAGQPLHRQVLARVSRLMAPQL
jgi:cardiolipin synthase A/B